MQAVQHPGERIRAEVIPKGMTVKKAAELVGVGRPALSNLLNGKAALSNEMAARLAEAFKKFSREELLAMQAEYDAAQAGTGAPAETVAYVLPLLDIKANQIEAWVERNTSARSRLAVLLRTLAHSTGRKLTKVDFPGNDDAERPGWDGEIVAEEGTPWIPVGRSGWEFGTNKEVKGKADDDFNKSVKAHTKEVRDEITFVFVTPRHWPGKAKWIVEAKAKGRWKDVKAYDSSDLEQWFAQSIPGQAWFANEIGIPAHDVRSLDKCWNDWAAVTTPPMIPGLFISAVDESRRRLIAILSNAPSDPTVIVADSSEEALAYLAQVFGELGGPELAAYRDRVLVFDKPGVLPRLAGGAQSFIAVAHSRDVEREFAPYAKTMHTIVIYPRNAAPVEPHINLGPLSHEAFDKAFSAAGKSRDQITLLAGDSGRSLTVLRRQMANGVLKTPAWAERNETTTSLVPFLFGGAWHNANGSDQAALSLFAGGTSYADLERKFQELAILNDPPVWSIGEYRGVVSKIDLLFAIRNAVTTADLELFFKIAEMVLAEEHPAIDLPEDKKWAANIYGKVREFSSAFRNGISETLVLLAVNGNRLFKHLGFDCEGAARMVVRNLLKSPLDGRALESNHRDLPTLAELAPGEFLSLLDADLKTDTPAVLNLLKPADSGILSSPSRSGLLWALEGLSWSPETLPHAVRILAQLARVEINDNWVNKPINSLRAIFRAWMPQTAVDLKTLVTLLKNLEAEFPRVAWKICVDQFGSYHEVGHYSHKPRWRRDGYGFGEPVEGKLVYEYRLAMIEMALSWPKHSVKTLGDLVEKMEILSPDHQQRIWALIRDWANSGATDEDKASLREMVRVSTLSRRAALRTKGKVKTDDLVIAAKSAMQALEPVDVLNKHEWLFRSEWIDESADDLEDLEDFDSKRHEERIGKTRVAAIRDVLSQLGVPGLVKLAVRGKAAAVVGWLSVEKDLLTEEQLVELLQIAYRAARDGGDGAHAYRSLIVGVLRGTRDDDKRARLIEAARGNLSDVDIVDLLVLAPYVPFTWKSVEKLSEAARARYWAEVAPDWYFPSDADLIESIDRLRKAGRPRAAFASIRYHPEKLDAQILYDLLMEMGKDGNDKAGEYMLEHYNVEQAFKRINSSPVLTIEMKAMAELLYLEVLTIGLGSRRDSYGIPNLERHIEKHPEVFVQAIVWAYKRDDKGEDPENFKVPPDRTSVFAERGYRLIEAIKRTPGHNPQDELDAKELTTWISTVRRMAADLSRSKIAEHCIGKILSHAPIGKDGVWPCEPVRDVLEATRSEDIMRAMHSGAYNSRGIHARIEGGDQERALAAKYRRWAVALQQTHPYVAAALLMKLVQTYEAEADREDTDADIRRRMR